MACIASALAMQRGQIDKAFVDLGYRGMETDNPQVQIVHQGKSKRISEKERNLLRRRQAIEPVIGHLKSDNRMDRCHLKGDTGDRLPAVLRAAGSNIRWLLRLIARKGITFLQRLYSRLCTMAGVSPNWQDVLGTLLSRALIDYVQRPVGARI